VNEENLMTNMMSSEVRGLSDTELDTVAGGNPYFAAGVVVGAAMVFGCAGAVAVGAFICDAMKDDEEDDEEEKDEVKIAPGT
jgi:hypothetical protein